MWWWGSWADGVTEVAQGLVGMEGVVEHYKKWNGDSDFGAWSIDQVRA